MAKSPAERKADQRARQSKVTGLHRIEIELSEREYQTALQGCSRRNPGRKSYGIKEYLELLLFCDTQRLERQESNLGNCNHCGEPLPQGCGAAFIGESRCWFTRGAKALNLTNVTGHANLDEVSHD